MIQDYKSKPSPHGSDVLAIKNAAGKGLVVYQPHTAANEKDTDTSTRRQLAAGRRRPNFMRFSREAGTRRFCLLNISPVRLNATAAGRIPLAKTNKVHRNVDEIPSYGPPSCRRCHQRGYLTSLTC